MGMQVLTDRYWGCNPSQARTHSKQWCRTVPELTSLLIFSHVPFFDTVFVKFEQDDEQSRKKWSFKHPLRFESYPATTLYTSLPLILMVNVSLWLQRLCLHIDFWTHFWHITLNNLLKSYCYEYRISLR